MLFKSKPAELDENLVFVLQALIGDLVADAEDAGFTPTRWDQVAGHGTDRLDAILARFGVTDTVSIDAFLIDQFDGIAVPVTYPHYGDAEAHDDY